MDPESIYGKKDLNDFPEWLNFNSLLIEEWLFLLRACITDAGTAPITSVDLDVVDNFNLFTHQLSEFNQHRRPHDFSPGTHQVNFNYPLMGSKKDSDFLAN